jgi:hypothetical protein
VIGQHVDDLGVAAAGERSLDNPTYVSGDAHHLFFEQIQSKSSKLQNSIEEL